MGGLCHTSILLLDYANYASLSPFWLKLWDIVHFSLTIDLRGHMSLVGWQSPSSGAIRHLPLVVQNQKRMMMSLKMKLLRMSLFAKNVI